MTIVTGTSRHPPPTASTRAVKMSLLWFLPFFSSELRPPWQKMLKTWENLSAYRAVRQRYHHQCQRTVREWGSRGRHASSLQWELPLTGPWFWLLPFQSPGLVGSPYFSNVAASFLNKNVGCRDWRLAGEDLGGWVVVMSSPIDKYIIFEKWSSVTLVEWVTQWWCLNNWWVRSGVDIGVACHGANFVCIE